MKFSYENHNTKLGYKNLNAIVMDVKTEKELTEEFYFQ
jgi:hypothetical protein